MGHVIVIDGDPCPCGCGNPVMQCDCGGEHLICSGCGNDAEPDADNRVSCECPGRPPATASVEALFDDWLSCRAYAAAEGPLRSLDRLEVYARQRAAQLGLEWQPGYLEQIDRWRR